MNSPKNLAQYSGNISSKIFSCICASANTGPACIRAKINSPIIFSCMYWFCAGGYFLAARQFISPLQGAIIVCRKWVASGQEKHNTSNVYIVKLVSVCTMKPVRTFGNTLSIAGNRHDQIWLVTSNATSRERANPLTLQPLLLGLPCFFLPTISLLFLCVFPFFSIELGGWVDRRALLGGGGCSMLFCSRTARVGGSCFCFSQGHLWVSRMPLNVVFVKPQTWSRLKHHYFNSVQTRCIVKGEAQKNPLFWRFSGSFWFSQDRLFSRNSTRNPLNLIKSPILQTPLVNPLVFTIHLVCTLLITEARVPPSRASEKKKRVQALEAQQRYFSYRAKLVAIVSQNSFVLVFMGYCTIIARYVARWGIAQMFLCEAKHQRGYCTILGER